jgi:hypothetical protein
VCSPSQGRAVGHRRYGRKSITVPARRSAAGLGQLSRDFHAARAPVIRRPPGLVAAQPWKPIAKWDLWCLTCCFVVEAIGTYSNLGHLCKKWAELRKHITESPARPPLSRQDSPKPRSKRFLTAEDITDVVHRYEAGESTQQVGNHYGISKTRVATILREQGVAIRRLGLPAEDVMEAATLYATGKSLAQIGARYGVSHTTVATAFRRQGFQLRPRPGWI